MKNLFFLLFVAFNLVLAQTGEKPSQESVEPITPTAIEPRFPMPESQDSVAQVPFFRPKVIVHREIVLPKDPFLAGALSLALSGTGQAYCGKWLKGIGFLAGSYLSYGIAIGIRENQSLQPGAQGLAAGTFLVIGLAMHVWSVVDGVNTANTHNRQLLETP